MRKENKTTSTPPEVVTATTSATRLLQFFNRARMHEDLVYSTHQVYWLVLVTQYTSEYTVQPEYQRGYLSAGVYVGRKQGEEEQDGKCCG